MAAGSSAGDAPNPRYLLRKRVRRQQQEAASISVITAAPSQSVGTSADPAVSEQAPSSIHEYHGAPARSLRASSRPLQQPLASVIRIRRSRRRAGPHRNSPLSAAGAATGDSQGESPFPNDLDAIDVPMSGTESSADAESPPTASLFGGALIHSAHQQHEEEEEEEEAGSSSTYAPQPQVVAQTSFDTTMAPRNAAAGPSRDHISTWRNPAAAVLNIMEQSGYGVGSEAAAALGRPAIASPRRGEESSAKRKMKREDFATELDRIKARALLLYDTSEADEQANDVWPNLRTASKRPVRYYRLENNGSNGPAESSATNKTAAGLAALDLATSKLRAAKASITTMYDRTRARPLPDSDVVMHTPLTWPAGVIPTEIYENIAGYLCRDDVKAMRLACREFDKHVSQVLFKRAVVPFNTEIYGMLTQGNLDPKRKRKAKSGPLLGESQDDIYTGHGLDVFRGFGSHILKFGMSFEIDEDALAAPPSKCLLETQSGFWGSYDWPYQEYCRYPRVAGLENTADETPRMTVAFSELTKVRELALSVDSGLGWLSGPDRSIWSQVLRQRPAIFGCQDGVPERPVQAQHELWNYIRSCHSDDEIKPAGLRKMRLTEKDLIEWPEDMSPSLIQPTLPFIDQRLLQEAVQHERAPTFDIYINQGKGKAKASRMFPRPPGTICTGILFTIPDATEGNQSEGFLIPNCLTTAQKEWLMETDWAQRAFLSSYMLSIMDNPTTFENIHTLNIARLSDRYLTSLHRHDFWDGLPNLHRLTIRAIPCWRDVYKDHAGLVHTSTLHPSSGINPFYDLLKIMISPRLNISHLTIGWAGGGEHAVGFHARNKLLLPPPILRGTSVSSWDDLLNSYSPSNLLVFPYVENLEFENCWMTPDSLVDFVKAHDGKLLKELTLRSVSLTTVPRPMQMLANAPNAPLVLQAQWQQLNQLMMTIRQQTLAAAPPPPAAPQNLPSASQATTTATSQSANMPLSTTLQLQVQARIANAQIAVQHVVLTPAGLMGLFHQVLTVANMLQQTLQQFQQEQSQASNSSQSHPSPASFFQQHNQQLNAITAITQNIPQLMVLVGAPPAPVPAAQPTTTNTTGTQMGNVLHTEFRRGSWVDVIDQISPGRNLADFGSDFSHVRPDRITCLDQINFESCGYAILPNYADMDQRDLMRDDPSVERENDAVQKRGEGIAQYMMSAKYQLLGTIMQRIDEQEIAALEAGWDLDEGWKDSEAAEGPLFDGQLRGGTGRFTGVIRREAET